MALPAATWKWYENAIIFFMNLQLLDHLVNNYLLAHETKRVCSFIFIFPEDAELTPLLRLGAGACAGIIAMSATYPMDLVRGRITVQVFYAL